MYRTPIDTGNTSKLPLDQDAWMMFRFENHVVIRLHLNAEGINHNLSASQAIAAEAGLNRFWKNQGSQILELLVIKTVA